MIAAMLVLRKSIKWARRVNPLLLTFAFMLDRPLYPVYPEYWQIISSCVTFSCTYLIPWTVSETLAGQILSWILTYTPILIQNHFHFDDEILPTRYVPFWLISLAIYINFALDLPVSIRSKI